MLVVEQVFELKGQGLRVFAALDTPRRFGHRFRRSPSLSSIMTLRYDSGRRRRRRLCFFCLSNVTKTGIVVSTLAYFLATGNRKQTAVAARDRMCSKQLICNPANE